MKHDDNEIPKHRSKKNTKKWCRGKVGVKHELVIRDAERYTAVSRLHNGKQWQELACQVCNKNFKTYFRFYWREENPEEDLQKLIKKLYGDDA